MLTMSAMSGSSGLGSDMSSWMDVRTVAMLRDGRQAPCTQTDRQRPRVSTRGPLRAVPLALHPLLTLGGSLRMSRHILPAESMFGW